MWFYIGIMVWALLQSLHKIHIHQGKFLQMVKNESVKPTVIRIVVVIASVIGTRSVILLILISIY